MAEKKKDEVDRYLIVTEPIADLRKEPLDSARGDYEYDDLQETQLLLNEVLLYRGENDEWYQVEAIEQSDFTPEALWRGYPGWVRKSDVREVKKVKRNTIVIKGKGAYVYTEPDQASKTIMTVSMGTRFHATGEIMGGFSQVSLPKGGNGWMAKRNTRDMARKIDEKQLRRRIVSTAKLFLGVPYLWGGRSVMSEVRGKRLEVRKNSKLAGTRLPAGLTVPVLPTLSSGQTTSILQGTPMSNGW